MVARNALPDRMLIIRQRWLSAAKRTSTRTSWLRHVLNDGEVEFMLAGVGMSCLNLLRLVESADSSDHRVASAKQSIEDMCGLGYVSIWLVTSIGLQHLR